MNIDIENAVIGHYEHGALLVQILAGLEASGIDPDNLVPGDLAPFEELHIGGRKATEYLVGKMGLKPTSHVVDVGCGIGGAARHVAGLLGGRVTGIDLTPEYIEVARALTKRVGLDERLRFETVSALAMPFGNASFDAAMTLHAAMNIPDRGSLYAEIARVMRPGGTLGIYDVMKKNSGGELVFPVPWAETNATSHLVTPEATCDLLRDAGFEVYGVEDRSDFAIDFFEKTLAGESHEPATLGIHLFMGETAREKLKNVLDSIVSGRIAPVQILAKTAVR